MIPKPNPGENREMPPRFAYWTILMDNTPTAFRARDREELLPTFAQLKRKSQDVVIKWFAQGRLWDSPEAQRSVRRTPAFTGEKRGSDWRPGGLHKDPRDRFKKKNRPVHAWSDKDTSVRRDRDKLGPPGESRPWRDKPSGPPYGSKPAGPPRGADRLWSSKPANRAPGGSRPWSSKAPSAGPPRGDRPW